MSARILIMVLEEMKSETRFLFLYYLIILFDYTDHFCETKENRNENNNSKTFFNPKRRLIGFFFSLYFDLINLLIDEL
jgi:hypothetical protein